MGSNRKEEQPCHEEHCNPDSRRCAYNKQDRQQYKQMAINRDEVAIEQVIFDTDGW